MSRFLDSETQAKPVKGRLLPRRNTFCVGTGVDSPLCKDILRLGLTIGCAAVPFSLEPSSKVDCACSAVQQPHKASDNFNFSVRESIGCLSKLRRHSELSCFKENCSMHHEMFCKRFTFQGIFLLPGSCPVKQFRLLHESCCNTRCFAICVPRMHAVSFATFRLIRLSLAALMRGHLLQTA